MSNTTKPTKLDRALDLLRRRVERDGPTKVAAELGIGRPTLWRWMRPRGATAPHALFVRHILDTFA
jgi:hypothetical protein